MSYRLTPLLAAALPILVLAGSVRPARAESPLAREGSLPQAGAPGTTEFLRTAAAAAPLEDPWSFSLAGALSLGQGNSDFFDMRFDFGAKYERRPWLFEFDATFVYGEREGTKNADNWRLRAHVERRMWGCAHAFATVQYDRDQLAGLDYRITAAAGLGYTFIETEKGFFKGELGGGPVIERRVGLPETVDPAGYARLEYERRWSGDRKLTADLTWLPNFSDFDLSLATFEAHYLNPICYGFSLDVGLRLDWVVDPPGTIEELDLLLTLGFRVEF